MQATERGTKVRFTSKSLGVLSADGRGFNPDIKVGEGDEGRYAEHKPVGTEQDWHLCTIERDGAIYVVPVHSSHFEVIG